ncbi:hypothetical protein [Bacteriophage Phobos]|uniref:Uncharacterized protein n=1 Tax=Bacteriophage Phobos TaxID=2662138 RepID=A0A5Q2U6Z7_9CAUD|nr:hypothetical protein JT319_gp56 [Bacteriophage Phobos]QGH45025.1 hypothetical protein [Bacteriophage Phobos]
MERMPFTAVSLAGIWQLCSGNCGGALVCAFLAFLFYFLIPAPEGK